MIIKETSSGTIEPLSIIKISALEYSESMELQAMSLLRMI